jgi:hypothetical protein
MTEGTIAVRFRDVDSSWKVYRVRTQKSIYHLGICGGRDGLRRCAVLRSTNTGDVTDCAPLIAGKSLFDVAPDSWVGGCLEIGTTKTSPVLGVDVEEDISIVRSITNSGVKMVMITPQGQAQLQPSAADRSVVTSRRPAYPEDFVERSEAAASYLRKCARVASLADDLRRYPHLLDRYRAALDDAATRLLALKRALDEGSDRDRER